MLALELQTNKPVLRFQESDALAFQRRASSRDIWAGFSASCLRAGDIKLSRDYDLLGQELANSLCSRFRDVKQPLRRRRFPSLS